VSPLPPDFDILQHINLAIVPEERPRDENGLLLGTARFWVATQGMAKFSRPELEMRYLHFLSVPQALQTLGTLAHHSVAVNPIRPGQQIKDVTGFTPCYLQGVATDNPFWKGKGVQCVRLVVVRIEFHACGQCGTKSGDAAVGEGIAVDPEFMSALVLVHGLGCPDDEQDAVDFWAPILADTFPWPDDKIERLCRTIHRNIVAKHGESGGG